MNDVGTMLGTLTSNFERISKPPGVQFSGTEDDKTLKRLFKSCMNHIPFNQKKK